MTTKEKGTNPHHLTDETSYMYTSEVVIGILKLCIEDYLYTQAFDNSDTRGKTFEEMGYNNKVLKSMTYEDMYNLLTEHLKYLESEG